MNSRISLLTVFILATAVNAETGSSESKAVGSQLPDPIRSLLIEEMQAINASMAKILTGLVSAHHELVAEQAKAIHDSFIMAQKITKKQRQVLKSTLPPAFIEKDQAFHQLSARLAEAARAQDSEQQLSLFQSMQAACVACHQQHATDRFPHFSKNQQ